MISQTDFISASEISEAARASMEELENREKYIDVGIVDYIKAYVSDEQLFYSCNHPSEKLIVEYTNRIMEHIGYTKAQIQPKDVVINVGILKSEDMPLYPAVIKYFNLKKYDNRYYVNSSIYPDMFLDFKQYMKIYIEMIKKEDVLSKI